MLSFGIHFSRSTVIQQLGGDILLDIVVCCRSIRIERRRPSPAKIWQSSELLVTRPKNESRSKKRVRIMLRQLRLPSDSDALLR